MAVFSSRSAQETYAFAMAYAKTLKRGDVVLLEGEMGAGKTVLAQGIVRGLGIFEEVTSPTYAYVNEYGFVFHFDCYRVQSVAQALSLGLADYFGRGGICLIEWGENIAELLPENVKRVRIAGTGETREVEY